jgi:hypothetical protein
MNNQSELLQERRDLFLQAHWQPTRNWALRVAFRDGVTRRQEAEQRFQRSWTLSSQYYWHQQHSASLQLTQQQSVLRETETTMVLNYEWQLSPALRQRQSVGGLYGQVLFRDGDGYRPASHVLVRVHDQAARTDENGHYEMRSLPPGEHSIRITLADPALAARMVDTSRSASVVAGQRTHWPIVMETLGRVVGQIHVIDSTSDDVPRGLLDAVMLESIQWILVQGEQRYWMPTNALGEFELSGLSPGEWEVSLVADSLPIRTMMKPATQTITIHSGQTQHIAFDLIRESPSFEWIDQGATHFSLD